jgi:hypothetical protein
MREYFLLIFLIIQLNFCSCSGQDKKVIWRETIGTLDPHGHSHGTIHYQVDGNMYSTTFYLRNENAVLGEKYTMRYNVNNPEETEIDYWHPIFVSGEKTYPFAATIKKVHKKSVWDPTPFVVYTFDIKGMHLQRYVYLPPNYQELYPDLQEGKRYEVECLAKDAANRVVLHLDKPIKN